MARELKIMGSVWQEEFFDHVSRSSESYHQKWEYVKENPVRAGLVTKSDDWPFQGEIESLMLLSESVKSANSNAQSSPVGPGSPIPATTLSLVSVA